LTLLSPGASAVLPGGEVFERLGPGDSVEVNRAETPAELEAHAGRRGVEILSAKLLGSPKRRVP
jgi:hypothetical protein